MRKLILFLLLPAQLAFAQENISLNDCYGWARENYPNLKQTEIRKEISELNKKNNQTGYLPQVSVNGQATYQSDVTHINIDIPNMAIPSVSKDQYKAYAEIRQTIWDGGLVAANDQLEEAMLQSNLSQLEVELYKLNEQVARAFFAALAIDKQKKVLEAQKKVLLEKLKAAQSGIKHQVVEQSAALILEAEILNLEQSKIEINAAEKAALQMLAILTGKTIEESSSLKYSSSGISEQQSFRRPESALFETQKIQLDKQSELLEKNRNPRLFGFGQAGYGKPGLNMLNNEFDTYYMVGLGLSWNVFDWKKTTRQKQELRLQQQLIDRQEETFNQNLEILLAQQNEQIKKLETLLKTDVQLVSLRTKIARASASKLENETITTSDYIQDIQAETVAKLNYELHKIQFNEAKEKYNLIKGKNTR
ncbi:Outer membrane protein TolC [Mariniphaga anaerophila]|uniref:Outer membrane protein TolC n=1 Tax=Mariniphaga anaerophila TaxID=1484053 RepID=A0A1M5FGB1_9BACT|nr:TolC family protein [Mariniphaga anaerophila]SHF90202.1 Outer membrane protein TolC [Mariniphaga anaerophila]